MSFGEFYQQGGVFMHAVSFFVLTAGTAIVARFVRGSKSDRVRVRAASALTGHLLGLAVAAGVLGTAFGFMELCGALEMIPRDQWSSAVARATPIALAPLTWSLMLLLPMGLIHAVGRYAERRRGAA
jgi:hypothetical protein